MLYCPIWMISIMRHVTQAGWIQRQFVLERIVLGHLQIVSARRCYVASVFGIGGTVALEEGTAELA